MTATEKAIAEIHAWYGQRTGVVTKLMFSQRLWHDRLCDYQYDAAKLRADCELIIRYLKREIGRDKRNLGALKPANFLQPDTFDADLAIARLESARRTNLQRRQKTTDKGLAIETPASDDFRKSIAEQMRAFRESLAQQPERNGKQ